MKCPNCDHEMEPYAEVDIGVGVQQSGPWGCPACGYMEPEENPQAKLIEPNEEDFDGLS